MSPLLLLAEEKDKEKNGIIVGSGGCRDTNDLASYLPTHLSVSGTTHIDNQSDTTSKVWRTDYVRTVAICLNAAVLNILYNIFRDLFGRLGCAKNLLQS